MQKKSVVVSALKKGTDVRSVCEAQQLVELIGALSVKELDHIWTLSAARVEARSNMLEDEAKEDEVMGELNGILALVAAYQLNKKRPSSKKFTNLLQTFHEIIFDMASEAALVVQNSIAKACETFWSQKQAGRETVMPSTIMFLLVRSLEETAKNADVTRVHAMHEGLGMLDLEGEGSEMLQHLLIRTMVSPLYLRSATGRRFLSFVLLLNINFMEQLHMAMKNQIPYAKDAVLSHYGDVYYRSWTNAEGQTRLALETNCIQDLISCGAHVMKQPTAIGIRNILKVFHQNKRAKGVDTMLNRLYAPVIWRALSAANSVVRHNALAMFIDVFPLQDGEAKANTNDELLQRQFEALRTLLLDTDAECRRIAVEGTSRILNQYWELIPVGTKQYLFSTLMKLAFDGNAAPVRASVLKGLTFLLDNHLSHATLKIFLPSVGPLLHDKSEMVSKAACDLLLAVKTVKSIRFFDVVPLDDILLRLQACPKSNAKRLTELLLNSYFPFQKGEDEVLTRALHLLENSPDVARVFYCNVYQFAPLAAVGDLMTLFYRALVQSCTADADTEDEDDLPLIDMKNAKVVESILCILARLWHTVDEQAAKNRFAKPDVKIFEALLQDTMGDGGMSDIYNCASLTQASRVAVLTLVARLSPEAAPAMTSTLLPELAKMAPDAVVAQYGPLVECLGRWNMLDQLVDMIVGSLNVTLAPEAKTESKKRKKSPKNAPLRTDRILALKYAQFCLDVPALQTKLFTDSFGQSAVMLMDTLAKAWGPLQEACQVGVVQNADSKFYLDCFSLWNKMSIHKFQHSANDQFVLPEETLGAMKFVTETIIPSLDMFSGQPTKNTTVTERSTKKARSIAPKDSMVTHVFVSFLIEYATELLSIGLIALDNPILMQIYGWIKNWANTRQTAITESKDEESVIYPSACLQVVLRKTHKLVYQVAVHVNSVEAMKMYSTILANMLTITPVLSADDEQADLVQMHFTNTVSELLNIKHDDVLRASLTAFVEQICDTNLNARSTQNPDMLLLTPVSPYTTMVIKAIFKSTQAVFVLPSVFHKALRNVKVDASRDIWSLVQTLISFDTVRKSAFNGDKHAPIKNALVKAFVACQKQQFGGEKPPSFIAQGRTLFGVEAPKAVDKENVMIPV